VLPASLRQITKAARRLNPLSLSRTLGRVDELTQATRELTRVVEALRTRTEQLAAIEQTDVELQDVVDALPSTLDTERIRHHVARAIANATLELDPFPHLVVDKWLPTETYKLMIDGLPDPIFFADRDSSRQRLSVPFRLAPQYSRRIWQLITRDIVSEIAGPLLNEKFSSVVRDYVTTFCPKLPEGADLTLRTSNGHIMLRRPGYVINPHRDPKWGFVTCLVYLARSGDKESYGTQLYRVKDDAEAPTFKPFYVEDSRCELVKTVPFRANSMLVFLNSTGAHGASIPADAQPRNLERYLYQFRLGPEGRTKAALLENMTEERRARWQSGEADADEKGY
jgi:hypothetical protein